jgi:hypothetical protein
MLLSERPAWSARSRSLIDAWLSPGKSVAPMAVGIDTTAPTASAGALYFISTFFAII